MPYITTPVTKVHQISFDDILFGISQEDYDRKIKNTHDTRTVYREKTPENLLNSTDFNGMVQTLKLFNEKYKRLIDTDDKSRLYKSFKIPKRSGGLRQIDEPIGELMTALRELKTLFETRMYASHHTCAYAYVRGRSNVDVLRRHQQNNSKWFLKLDFHNFFGSTTPEFTYRLLTMIFPFNVIVTLPDGELALKQALSLCFLNGGLPQGTPISPALTNLIMIPVDHYIAKYCREHSPHLVYTRYADDMALSSDLKFSWQDVQKDIIEILDKFSAPFTLNTKKTRFGSSAGSNWNLGLMLNKDNQITIGHAKKKLAKACVFQFMTDFEKGTPWSLEDTQQLQGSLSYYTAVEPNFVNELYSKYSQKFGKDVKQIIKQIIKGGA